MAKIRISEKDKTEYNKLMKNAKSKMKRIQKNYGINLIGEIPLPTLSAFQSRKQFNEWKQEVSSFTNRNNQRYQYKMNKQGVVASKATLNEIERNTKRLQRAAEKVREKLSPLAKQGLAEKERLMKRPDALGVKKIPDFNFNDIKNKQELERLRDKTKKKIGVGAVREYDKKMEKMKNNFIKLVREAFHSDADDFIKKLEGMNPIDFYDMYMMSSITDDDVFDFNLYYNLEGEAEGKPSQLIKMEHFAEFYIQDKYISLKDFPNVF